MKTIIIRSVNSKWLATGLNFDVSQYSKIGCILNIWELVNFCNLNKVTIKNKDILVDDLQKLLKH